jgi:hypothetical protein
VVTFGIMWEYRRMESTTICARCGDRSAGRPLSCEACGEDPRVAGRYRLEAELGRGGGGVTWRARREPGGEPICLKELRWATMPELDAERRFTREGELLSQLSHAAIPRHHGAFSWGEGRQHALYIAQELVVGENLEVERRTRGYTEREVLAVGLEVADVLVYLHERHPPMVHRDIKPSNLMRRVDGRIVVVDFGAARLMGLGDSQVSVAGTFGFMAPEQIRGEAGPSSDVYGLGMTLAVLLSGGPPEALLDASNRPAPERIGSRGSPLSRGLIDLITDMVALSPAARPTAREVCARLAELMAGRVSPPPRAEAVLISAGAKEESQQNVSSAGRATRGVAFSTLMLTVAVAGGAFVISNQTKSTVVDAAEVAIGSLSLDGVLERGPDGKLIAVIHDDPERMPTPTDPPEPPPLSPEERKRQDILKTGELCLSGKVSACKQFRGWVRREDELVAGLGLPGGPWPQALIKVCEGGEAEVCAELAAVYSQGDGVEASRLETRRWFERACEFGSDEGCESFGHMVMKGDGGRPDPKAALVPLEKGCGLGNDEACVSVGAIYAEGMGGVRADRAKALGIFEGLCDRGHRTGCQNLAAMVGNDWGLPTGRARYETLARLCEKRVGVACHRLGTATASGAGVPRDAEKAKALFTKGCDLGFADSCKRL